DSHHGQGRAPPRRLRLLFLRGPDAARVDEGGGAEGVDHVPEDDEGQEDAEGQRVALRDEVDRAGEGDEEGQGLGELAVVDLAQARHQYRQHQGHPRRLDLGRGGPPRGRRRRGGRRRRQLGGWGDLGTAHRLSFALTRLYAAGNGPVQIFAGRGAG